jgi:hypothetical protein
MDAEFYNSKTQRWLFVLVPKGMRTLRIIRPGHKIEEETHLAGTGRWLELETRVLYKPDNRIWRRMFWLTLIRGTPSIKFGKQYGPLADQYRVLSKLSAAAHLNAGIDPAWRDRWISASDFRDKTRSRSVW